jgi:exodeoxyribonuclease VII large subunit
LRLATARLAHSEPDIGRLRRDLAQCAVRLSHTGKSQVTRQGARLASAVQTLQALNPRNILGRGYAIVRNARGEIVKDAGSLHAGDPLGLELHRGGADVTVVGLREPVIPG